MPNQIQHLNQCKHNNNTLSLLCKYSVNKIWDWKVTICFYAALHLMHAHLAKNNCHPQSHGAVRKEINPIRSNPNKVSDKAWQNYMALENISHKGRYLDNSISFCGVKKEWFTSALIHYNAILEEYDIEHPSEISGFKVVVDHNEVPFLKFINIITDSEPS